MDDHEIPCSAACIAAAGPGCVCLSRAEWEQLQRDLEAGGW